MKCSAAPPFHHFLPNCHTPSPAFLPSGRNFPNFPSSSPTTNDGNIQRVHSHLNERQRGPNTRPHAPTCLRMHALFPQDFDAAHNHIPLVCAVLFAKSVQIIHHASFSVLQFVSPTPLPITSLPRKISHKSLDLSHLVTWSSVSYHIVRSATRRLFISQVVCVREFATTT